MTEKTLFAMGRVTGVHGLRGNLKVHSYAQSADVYEAGLHILLRSAGEQDFWYTVSNAMPYKKGILLSLEGVGDVDCAETLVGKEVFISRDILPAPEEESFFWQDLIGLNVVDTKKGDIGKIDHILFTGANDVFVVKKDGDQGETLIPVIKSVVHRVSIEEKRVEVELPDGL